MHQILIVDDHPISSEGLLGIIERQDDLKACGMASTASEALELIHNADDLDLVLVDINLPDRSGLDLIKETLAFKPALPILVISMHDESLYAERSLRAGARGYVMKETSPATLLVAIRRVLAGGVFLSESMASHLLMQVTGRKTGDHDPIDRLSDREFEVLQWIGQGQDSKEISQRLGISPRTVDSHRARIKEKLNLKTGAELTRYAIRWVESQ